MSEMNKDEALRCLEISKAKYSQGNTEGALKFAQKSVRLFPSPEASSWVDFVTTHPAAAPSSASPGPSLRQRKAPKTAEEDAPPSRPFTPEQVEGITKIKKHKAKGDLYAILGLKKGASDSDIKKGYRKLALQFHPDKCGAPGTDDAFKAIGHAFAVLGDRDKKAAYDVYGVDPESAGGRRPPPSSRGHPMHHNFAARSGYQSFDGDISPEDLFNMFFGDMAGAQQQRTSGPGFRTNRARTQQTRRQFTRQSSSYIQLLPLLGLFLFSLISFFAGGWDVSDFSFTQTKDFNALRTTQQHSVPYYVNSYQHSSKYEYAPSRQRDLDRKVEKQYYSRLQYKCSQEREVRNHKIAQARGWFISDDRKLRAAWSTPMPSCEALRRW